MKPSARMSESASWPPKLQCTFSNVQQKSVARKKKLVTLHASSVLAPSVPGGRACTRDVQATAPGHGELLARVRRETLRPPLGG